MEINMFIKDKLLEDLDPVMFKSPADISHSWQLKVQKQNA